MSVNIPILMSASIPAPFVSGKMREPRTPNFNMRNCSCHPAPLSVGAAGAGDVPLISSVRSAGHFIFKGSNDASLLATCARLIVNIDTLPVNMSTSKQVRVAVTQAEPVWLDLDATVDKTCSLIAEAASNGAQLIAFPECWIPGYPAWIW